MSDDSGVVQESLGIVKTEEGSLIAHELVDEAAQQEAAASWQPNVLTEKTKKPEGVASTTKSSWKSIAEVGKSLAPDPVHFVDPQAERLRLSGDAPEPRAV